MCEKRKRAGTLAAPERAIITCAAMKYRGTEPGVSHRAWAAKAGAQTDGETAATSGGSEILVSE
jgi:hypothetical protein